MRLSNLRSPSFAVGFTLGLVVTAVTFAFARVMKRRSEPPERTLVHPVIDGARPIDPVNLTVGPEPEPEARNIRLESESIDPPANSQRW